MPWIKIEPVNSIILSLSIKNMLVKLLDTVRNFQMGVSLFCHIGK